MINDTIQTTFEKCDFCSLIKWSSSKFWTRCCTRWILVTIRQTRGKEHYMNCSLDERSHKFLDTQLETKLQPESCHVASCDLLVECSRAEIGRISSRWRIAAENSLGIGCPKSGIKHGNRSFYIIPRRRQQNPSWGWSRRGWKKLCLIWRLNKSWQKCLHAYYYLQDNGYTLKTSITSQKWCLVEIDHSFGSVETPAIRRSLKRYLEEIRHKVVASPFCSKLWPN